jgi:signal transduction histidine kinase
MTLSKDIFKSFNQVLILILVSIVLPFTAMTQRQNNVYKLLSDLQMAKNDSIRCQVFFKLAQTYGTAQPDAAFARAKTAWKLSQNLKYTDLSIKSIELMMKLATDSKKDANLAYSVLTMSRGVDTAGLSLSQKGSWIGLEARMNFLLGDLAKAQETSFRQLDYFDLAKDTLGIADTRLRLGKIFFAQQDFKEALQHFQNSLIGFSQKRNLNGKVEALNAIGETYGHLEEPQKSLQFAGQALANAYILADENLKARILLNMGKAYQNLGLETEALNRFQRSLDISESLSNSAVTVEASAAIGKLFLSQGKLSSAEEYLITSKQVAEISNDLELKKTAYEGLYRFYELKGKKIKAYEILTELVSLKDSLTNGERARELVISQVKYETGRKDQENKKLKAAQLENQVIIANQRSQLFLTTGLVVVIIFLSLFLYVNNRRRKKFNLALQNTVTERTQELKKTNEDLSFANEKLEQSNLELERFAYIASHDLKSPLRNIISFLSLVMRRLKNRDEPEIKEYLGFAVNNAHQMSNLIQDVLEFSRIDNNKASKEEMVDLNETMVEVVQNLSERMLGNNAEVICDVLPEIKTNPIQIMQLFQNLAGNGLKYNISQHKKITIKHDIIQDSSDPNKKQHLFIISDNGIGIDTQYHDKIFEMFKRLHSGDEYQGTGIGLAICKKIVQNFNGRIWLDSTVNEGSTFYFTHPMSA